MIFKGLPALICRKKEEVTLFGTLTAVKPGLPVVVSRFAIISSEGLVFLLSIPLFTDWE